MASETPTPSAAPAAVMSGDETRTVMRALLAEVDLQLDRIKVAPNDAIRFSEHAQALGLLRAVEIVKEHL